MTASLAAMFMIVIIISMPMSVPTTASFVLVGSRVSASCLQQLISCCGIVHHRLVRRLFVSLDC
jgi:hypothetical protein